MELTQSPSRIHPLVAGAAVSVTLVSLLGIAAVTGLLPNSHGSIAPKTAATTDASVATSAPLAQIAAAPVLVQTPSGYQYMQPVNTPVSAYQVAPQTAPAVAPVHHAHTTHHHAQTYAQADTGYRNEPRQQAQPVYQQPARAANSPVGIATGAVVGGLLGNQIGKGNGRTLATVAGAVGGGYLGNIAGQKYGY